VGICYIFWGIKEGSRYGTSCLKNLKVGRREGNNLTRLKNLFQLIWFCRFVTALSWSLGGIYLFILVLRNAVHPKGIAGSRPGVTCAGDGARRIWVDDQSLVSGGREPSHRLLDGYDFWVEGGLLGTQGLAPLVDGVPSFIVDCDNPSQAGGCPEGAIGPRVI
jgi:hypothetical protein